MFVFHPKTMVTGLGTAGDNIALGDARPGGFRSFAAAGYADDDKVLYHLLYGDDWEVGVGYVDDTAETLVRYADHVLEPTAGTLLDVVEDEECIVSVEAPMAIAGFRGLIIKKTTWYFANGLTGIPFDTVLIDTDGLYTGGGSGQSQFTIPDWCTHAKGTLFTQVYANGSIGSLSFTHKLTAYDGGTGGVYTATWTRGSFDYTTYYGRGKVLRSPVFSFAAGASRYFKAEINDTNTNNKTVNAMLIIELLG